MIIRLKPIRPAHPLGCRDPGPHDPTRKAENPDRVNPPATDSGTLPSLRFSFSDAHVRKGSGSWTFPRQVAAALVEIEPGRLRELHWHPNNGEW